MNTETTTTSCLLSRSQALSQLSPFSLLLVNILADGPELMHTILYIDDDRIDNKTATPLPVDSEAIYVCDRFMSGCATLHYTSATVSSSCDSSDHCHDNVVSSPILFNGPFGKADETF
jgi:hypothetical protein